MSHFGKVSKTFEFLRVFRAEHPSKSLRVAEKNKENVEANCTALASQPSFWFSVTQWLFGPEKNSFHY